MKFNISYPVTGAQKCIEIDDDKKCNIFMDKRMGQEIEADSLGDEFKGYIFKIAGGNDKQGFPMKQGVFAKGRVRLLLTAGHSCFTERRSGFKKRKSIRGCIVGPDMRVLALQIVKKGEQEIAGVTDTNLPRKLGPKRANKIKKLFGLKKEDDQILVKKSVIRRTFKSASGKERVKSTKIQRLITPERLRRKKVYLNEKKSRSTKTKAAKEEYEKFLVEWRKQRTATSTAKQTEEKPKVAPAKVATTVTTDKKVVDTKAKTAATTTQKTATQAKTTAPVAVASKTAVAPVAKKAPAPQKAAPVAADKKPVAKK